MILQYPLITTIVASIVFAFLFGLLANRLKLPTILGYLVAGMLIGPHTPGFIANIDIAKQLAEIGIILLMFGVGLHFSLKDLFLVRKVALPGAIVQIVVITFGGILITKTAGYSLIEGIIFGLTISVASTVVLLRALEQYRLIKHEVGKISIGWLVIEDIIMILAIVLLPLIATSLKNQQDLHFSEIASATILMLLKIIIFAFVMVAVARKILPTLLVKIAKTKSRELMSLGILAIALGFAFVSYSIFGASFALGAFFAGLVLNESEIGIKSAKQSLPLRDTFAVLFFISVGMLFDYSILLREPLLVMTTFVLIIFGKSFFAYLIMRLFKQSKYNSLVIAAGFAQVGEFSFILSALALKLEIFSTNLHSLILAGALLSIAVNPFLFKVLAKNQKRN